MSEDCFHGHLENFKAVGSSLTSGWQWVAALDDRTCPACGELDGQTWAYDDAYSPKQPLHSGCRCTVVPVINWAVVGLPSNAAELIVPSTRASMDGPVPQQTYAEWLQARRRSALAQTAQKVVRYGSPRTKPPRAAARRRRSQTDLLLVADPPAVVSSVTPLVQNAPAGHTVPEPPAVRVADAAGQPVPRLVVTFAITAGGGLTDPPNQAKVNTNIDGVASLRSWTLGCVPGTANNVLTATVPEVAGNPINFTASAIAC
jgi:hypothetical protein